jgi:hypothetical protein
MEEYNALLGIKNKNKTDVIIKKLKAYAKALANTK